MKRLTRDIPKWHILQHRDARGLPLPSPNDQRQLQLEDELFERLYVGETDPLTESTNPALRAWAEQIHSTLDNLPAFARLAAECRGDATAAAAAVETLLDSLDRHLPEPGQPSAPAPAAAQRDPLRRPAAEGCAAAARTVEELKDATEGLSNVLFSVPGKAGAVNTPGDGQQTRPLATLLRKDHRLRQIALLAGRMKRIAASKRRSRVKHGADEITDVEQGADVARALPAELAKLVHPRRRLDFFRSLLERQVLQYQLVGTEKLGRGPLVVLLDKSASMDGRKDLWATALALALLEHAQTERRAFALVDFNGHVTYEAMVRPGQAIPHEALFVSCAGGTQITTAIQRGLDIIRENLGTLRKADLVLVTDGEDSTEGAQALRDAARTMGVHILGAAIGFPAAQLTAWCDDAYGITDLETVEPKLAEALFANA
jgi:uncharacterized protein with von Willebrand factor type A (vWA) domain